MANAEVVCVLQGKRYSRFKYYFTEWKLIFLAIWYLKKKKKNIPCKITFKNFLKRKKFIKPLNFSYS